MKTIIVTNQKEFNSIESNVEARIEITNTTEAVCVNRNLNNAYMVVSYNATIKSVYDNATIEYVYDNATIESVSGNATIEYVSGNATIKYVSGNATIKYVYGNATIEYVSGNATIEYVYGNATIEYVSGNATIKYVSGNATIKSVYDNATILLMTGLASVLLLYSANKIIAKGMNLIRQIGTEKIDIQKTKDVVFVQVKETISKTPEFSLYKKLYPVTQKGQKVTLYKAVHKIDGKYIANYDKKTEYKVGEIMEIKCDKSQSGSCSFGIHLSHLYWAVLFGNSWPDMAILECETDEKDIVVSKDCDGKVRTSKIKVIRELDPKEY